MAAHVRLWWWVVCLFFFVLCRSVADGLLPTVEFSLVSTIMDTVFECNWSMNTIAFGRRRVRS